MNMQSLLLNLLGFVAKELLGVQKNKPCARMSEAVEIRVDSVLGMVKHP